MFYNVLGCSRYQGKDGVCEEIGAKKISTSHQSKADPLISKSALGWPRTQVISAGVMLVLKI